MADLTPSELEGRRRGGRKVQALGLAHRIEPGAEARAYGQKGGRASAARSRGKAGKHARRVRVPAAGEAPERVRRACRLRGDGLSLAAVAGALGVTVARVLQMIRPYYL